MVERPFEGDCGVWHGRQAAGTGGVFLSLSSLACLIRFLKFSCGAHHFVMLGALLLPPHLHPITAWSPAVSQSYFYGFYFPPGRLCGNLLLPPLGLTPVLRSPVRPLPLLTISLLFLPPNCYHSSGSCGAKWSKMGQITKRAVWLSNARVQKSPVPALRRVWRAGILSHSNWFLCAI